MLTLQRLYRFKVRQRELGEWAALKLQTCARRFLARHAYNRKRNAAVAIQSARRALLLRIVFRRQRMAVCRIQSRCRGRRARQQVAAWVSAAVYIERCQRGHVARLAVKTMREELRLLGIAATACQTKLRGSLARRWLRRLRSATVKVQAFVRGHTARQRVAEQHAAATTIQKRQRMVVALRIWRAQRGAVQVWQRFARGWSTRKALAEELRQIKLAKVLWAEMDESDVKKMVTEPTKENLERMIELNNKFEGQLRALRSAAALNPNSLTSPRGIAIEKPEFDVMFSEPGSLGIRFAPHKRTGDMEVTAVKPGTQAQRHKSLHPGLVLIAVAGVDVAGKAPREVFDMLKQGGRPLKLSLLCPRLKRSGAESPVDHKSLTEPVRLYEHGAVPSPPSAPTVRIPMTPHKLTKPQIRRQPSPSRHLTAVPQRGLEGASARALRLSPSPDAGETTSSGKDAWNRTTKSNPDESWAKMQAAEAAAAQQLAQQRADAPHRAGIKVSSTIGVRKPQSTASTAANSTAKAKAKTVPEQQLNQHTLSLPGTRLQVAHSHRKRQPPVPPVVRPLHIARASDKETIVNCQDSKRQDKALLGQPNSAGVQAMAQIVAGTQSAVPPVVRPLHIARASDKETIVNCQGRKRQHKALQGQPDSAGVQAMAQIVAGTQSAVARPQSAERQLSRYAPAQRDNRAGTVHSQKKNRQPPAQLPPRDAGEVTAIRHIQPRPRERKALLGPPIPRSTMTGGVEEGVPPVPTEEKLRPRTPPPHGARAPDKDMANVAIVDGHAGVNTMAKIAGATHARWRTANQASDPP